MNSPGKLNNNNANNANASSLATYLSSDINIVGGTGESGTGAFKLSE